MAEDQILQLRAQIEMQVDKNRKLKTIIKDLGTRIEHLENEVDELEMLVQNFKAELNGK